MTPARSLALALAASALLSLPIACSGAVEGPACGEEVCDAGQCCIESCGGPEASFACAEPPDACPAIYGPVCGCDGVTYGNECEALAACVAVLHSGPCDGALCGGDTCGADECCLTGCGGVDADQCVVPDGACPEYYQPVCGCDGMTYDNPCFAHAACVAVASDGACAVDCAYVDPTADGCPSGTVECLLGGPAVTCIAPELVEACCCPLCA